MTINIIESENNTVVIQPEGNLDYITSPELDDAVVAAAEKAQKMIIDLREISYIASAGLRVLINADDLMSDKGGMVLTNVNDYVMEILQMTGFINELTIE